MTRNLPSRAVLSLFVLVMVLIALNIAYHVVWVYGSLTGRNFGIVTPWGGVELSGHPGFFSPGSD